MSADQITAEPSIPASLIRILQDLTVWTVKSRAHELQSGAYLEILGSLMKCHLAPPNKIHNVVYSVALVKC